MLNLIRFSLYITTAKGYLAMSDALSYVINRMVEFNHSVNEQAGDFIEKATELSKQED